jgi:hypothetical protein
LEHSKTDCCIDEVQVKKYRDNESQTNETIPRESTLTDYKLNSIKEFKNESDDGDGESDSESGSSEEFDTGARSFLEKETVKRRGNRSRHAQSYSINKLERTNSSINDEKNQELKFDVTRQLFKRNRAGSVGKHNWFSPPSNSDSTGMIKIFEENIKLEEKIQEMSKFSQENIKLKEELSNAQSKMSEQEEKIMKEKDDQIMKLAQNLDERENRYKNLANEFHELKRKLNKSDKKDYDTMFEEKELELEKINHMNASYRAQLIEMKISMSKSRDIGRFNNKKDEHEVFLNNEEDKFEKSKETIEYLEDKGKLTFKKHSNR